MEIENRIIKINGLLDVIDSITEDYEDWEEIPKGELIKFAKLHQVVQSMQGDIIADLLKK